MYDNSYPTGPASDEQHATRGIFTDVMQHVQQHVSHFDSHGPEDEQSLSIERGLLFSSGGDDKIATGLKECLTVGIDNSLKILGQTNGFFKNAAAKILLPEQLRHIADLARKFGFGAHVDNFEKSMNTAAEKSIPAGRDIMIDTITHLKFDDVKKIWQGGENAITNFFKEKTSGSLKKALGPLIGKAIEENNVAKNYKHFVGAAREIPFVKEQGLAIDIEDYTSTKAIEGLFHVLADEEKKIRQDPAARISHLLKVLFAK